MALPSRVRFISDVDTPSIKLSKNHNSDLRSFHVLARPPCRGNSRQRESRVAIDIRDTRGVSSTFRTGRPSNTMLGEWTGASALPSCISGLHAQRGGNMAQLAPPGGCTSPKQSSLLNNRYSRRCGPESLMSSFKPTHLLSIKHLKQT